MCPGWKPVLIRPKRPWGGVPSTRFWRCAATAGPGSRPIRLAIALRHDQPGSFAAGRRRSQPCPAAETVGDAPPNPPETGSHPGEPREHSALLRHGSGIDRRPVPARRGRDQSPPSLRSCRSGLHQRRDRRHRSKSPAAAAEQPTTTGLRTAESQCWCGIAANRSGDADQTAGAGAGFPEKQDTELQPFRVIGAGPAGIEVVLALRRRWPQRALELQTRPHQLDRSIQLAMAAADVRLVSDEEPARGPALLCSGSDAPPWLSDCGFPVDDQGRVRTDACLNVVGHPDIFASGDWRSWW